MTDDRIIEEILAREGGYVDRAEDRGGPTNFGITQQSLRDWRQDQGADVKSMTEAEARSIYEARYIKGPGFDAITDDRLRGLIVDCGVNSGPKAAIEWLQKCVGVPADGVLGPQTIAAVEALGPEKAYLKLCAARVRFLGRLITANSSQSAFAAGWMNRVAAFIEG